MVPHQYLSLLFRRRKPGKYLSEMTYTQKKKILAFYLFSNMKEKKLFFLLISFLETAEPFEITPSQEKCSLSHMCGTKNANENSQEIGKVPSM